MSGDDLAALILIIAKGFFWFSLTILILSVVMPPPPKEGVKRPDKEKSCPPHAWDYDVNGQMYCKLCPRKPGQ